MKTQLFLLHFAGGNCYSYHFLRPYLEHLELVPLELPGRGRRSDEKLLTRFEDAAEDLFQHILLKATGPRFLVYGHSLGALLALEVTGMLERAGMSPRQLIVSGNAGPGTRDTRKRYLLEKEDFRQELRTIGGVPDELLGNDEVLDFFEPVLRADFELVESNPRRDFRPVATPMYAVMGDREADAPKIGNWQQYTTGGFRHALLPGHHFFIYGNADALAGIITSCHQPVRLPAPEGHY